MSRHRRRQVHPLTGQIGLAVALVMAGVYLSLPAPRRANSAAPVGAAAGPVTLAKAWKDAAPSSARGLLPDGMAFSPLLYTDAQTSIGTAPSPDGTAVRLLLRVGEGEPKELHRVGATLNPQFTGLVADDHDVVWAESTADAKGQGETRIYKADRRTGTPAVALTADTGDIVFFNSQYDMVLANGQAHWVSAARTDDPQTELRSVPLAGGKVTVRKIPGAYALSAWPWLVSAASGQAGPVEMFNPETGAKVHVPAQSTELIGCTPTWCRALVLSATGGPARIDLMHPDGSQRQREAGSTASAAVQDVALLDRFDVLSQSESGSASGSQQLMLYDAKAKRTVVVASGVGVVQARGGVLFWSTGENAAVGWHALDLRTLA